MTRHYQTYHNGNHNGKTAYMACSLSGCGRLWRFCRQAGFRPACFRLAGLWLVSFILLSGAQAFEIAEVRLDAYEARTRLVVRITEQVDFAAFLLANPYRAVIDLPATESHRPSGQTSKGLVANIRYGRFSQNKFRIVLDLRGPVKIDKQFLLPPSVSDTHYRLVLDLVPVLATAFVPTGPAAPAAPVAPVAPIAPVAPVAPSAAVTPPAQVAPPAAVAPPAPVPTPDRIASADRQNQNEQIMTPKARPAHARPVIVIDPGHGGIDPGAQGRKIAEKNIVLTFSHELVRQLRASGRYDVYMTRQHDIYIPLRERVAIARRHNADLFISIHADAVRRRHVRGMSIYTLSENASDREAAELARKENQSDIIAGIDIGDYPPEVTSILIDLSQRETKNQSVQFANHVVETMQGEIRLLERTHRFAGFRVLKAPDVPSVLVELGFLTNWQDEKQLLSADWRRKVASGMVRALNSYFTSRPQLTP